MYARVRARAHTQRFRAAPFNYRCRKRNELFPANSTGAPFAFQRYGTERKRHRFFDAYCTATLSNIDVNTKCSQRKQVTVLDLDGKATTDPDSDSKDDHPEEDPTSEVKDPATFRKPDDTNLTPHSHTPTPALDTNQTPRSRTPSISHKPDDFVDKGPLDIPSSSKLMLIKRQSTSRRNFAKNVTVETYSEKERLESNVMERSS